MLRRRLEQAPEVGELTLGELARKNDEKNAEKTGADKGSTGRIFIANVKVELATLLVELERQYIASSVVVPLPSLLAILDRIGLNNGNK